jgi:Uma2 family endonuclease
LDNSDGQNDRKYTYGDYLTWPDDERWEIFEGVARRLEYEMNASPASRHQDVLLELAYQFKIYLKGKFCKVFVAPFDVRFSRGNEKDGEIETVVQPDIVVVCDQAKIDEKGCRGVPDFIIEIVSPSTAKKDMIEKLNLYEKYGVREYWIIHPADRVVTVFVIGADGKYGRPVTYGGEDKVRVGIFSDLEIDLKGVFEG